MENYFDRINKRNDPQKIIPEMIADAEVKKRNGTNPKTYEKINKWVKDMRCFAKTIDADLTNYEKSIWLIIHGAKYDESSQISIQEIYKRAGCSERKAESSIKRLIELGYLEKVIQGNSYTGASVYKTYAERRKIAT